MVTNSLMVLVWVQVSTFLIFAGILLALCVIYFISSKVSPVRTIVGIILFVVCCVFGWSGNFAFWEKDLTYEGESIYNYLQVREDDRSVILSTNVLFGVQSIYQKDGGLTGMYYDYAMAAPVMAGVYDNDAEKKEDFSVLVLGNGSGTFATQCQKHFGIDKIDAVEIDGSITDLAREYFALPEDVNVYTYDGRAYLNASEDKYNVIMVDAYQDITVPFQMSSKEFFALVKDHLKEDGVLVVNMSMRGKGENTINSYLADTISTLFSEVYTIDVTYSSNRELFASNNKDMMDVFKAGYEPLIVRSNTVDHDVFLMSDTVYKGMERYVPGDRVMTDDKAPVELLSMQAIDGIIYDEVAYFKDIYNEKGIKGVIDALQ